MKKGGEKITVFIVETYVVKSGKQGELMTLLKRIAEYKKRESREVQRDEIKENLLSNVWRHLW